jgi:hypothetical protein
MERKDEKEVNERKKATDTEKLWAVGQSSFSGHNQHISLHSGKFFGRKHFQKTSLYFHLWVTVQSLHFTLSAESTS